MIRVEEAADGNGQVNSAMRSLPRCEPTDTPFGIEEISNSKFRLLRL